MELLSSRGLSIIRKVISSFNQLVLSVSEIPRLTFRDFCFRVIPLIFVTNLPVKLTSIVVQPIDH